MDLSQFNPAQLDDLAVALFDELGKRPHQAKILKRLSNDGLWNMILSILGVFHERYVAADEEDKVLYEEAFITVVQRVFPDYLQAFAHREKAIYLMSKVLDKYGPMMQGPRKQERFLTVHRYVQEYKSVNKSPHWPTIHAKLRAIDQEWVTKKNRKAKRVEDISPDSLRRQYEGWLKKNPQPD